MAGVVVLDASVLIAFFEGRDAFHSRAVDCVSSAITRGDRLVANEVTVAEFLVGPVRSGIAEQAGKRLADLGITRMDFPASFAPQLAQIRHEAKVKLPDAAVLLTALDMITTGAARVTVATFDDRLRAGARHYGIESAIDT